MKSFAKRVSTAFGLFFLFFILLFPVKVHAWDAHLNENGDVEIYTTDKKRTTNIYYFTEGVTITRCQYDPTSRKIHESKLFFPHALENPVNILKGNRYYDTYTISISNIISGASALDPAWAQEIQDAVDGTGPAVYIKLDCIMYVVNDNIHKRYGPFMNAPGFGGSDGNLDVGVTETGESMARFGFNLANGLKTHFNHYLIIGNVRTPEPGNYKDELVTQDYTMDHYANIDLNQPTFAMGNYSTEFELKLGIPSSEYIDNVFIADSWYGNTGVYARIVNQSYKHTMTYKWQTESGYWNPIDKDQDGIYEDKEWITTYDDHQETHNLDIGTAYVAFQYLTDTHIYDFTNADIKNGAYPGDHIYYDDTNEVPMSCISTKKYSELVTTGTLQRGEPVWEADTKAHVTMGTFTYKNEYDFGVKSGRPDIEGQIQEDIKAIRDIISRNTRTKNDRLVIDGHTFMNDEVVIGCNFPTDNDGAFTTYKQCTKSAAWVHDYLQQTNTRPLHAYDPADVTGTTHVQIPPTVDNGQYPTSMKVFYQRLIAYTKEPAQFSAN